MKNVAKPAHIQLNAIKQTLANFENGASLEEIILATGLEIELRTFQRRMAILKEKGEITVSGDTRSTRYHLVKEKSPTGVSEPAEPYGKIEQVLPLSDASREIIAAISLPLGRRTPVGYNREYLGKYRPNMRNNDSKSWAIRAA
jgi:hypothetical protein